MLSYIEVARLNRIDLVLRQPIVRVVGEPKVYQPLRLSEPRLAWCVVSCITPLAISLIVE